MKYFIIIGICAGLFQSCQDKHDSKLIINQKIDSLMMTQMDAMMMEEDSICSLRHDTLVEYFLDSLQNIEQ